MIATILMIAICLSSTLGSCSCATTLPPSPFAATKNLTAAAAASARRLVNESTWGVVSNNAYNFGNTPFGNVLSFADGGTGTPYFYLTTFDQATANYSVVDQKSSLTVGEFALGKCGGLDPQDPMCAKVTLLGKLKPVKKNSREEAFAKSALFGAHERFKLVPKVAKFRVFKLDVQFVYVVDSYKDSPKFPSRDEYYNAISS